MRPSVLALLVNTAFITNFAWEMTQAPFFANIADERFLSHALMCLAATLGDLLILAVTYSGVALLVRDPGWIGRPRAGRLAAWIVLGLAATVVLERNALASGRWQYSASMPVVAGVGLVPLAQWIIIPLLIVAVARAAVTVQ